MVEAAVAAFGGLDVVVANAGIVSTADFLELSEEEWDNIDDHKIEEIN
ncbi:MAG: SDR family NAD(P)-dependent oxidoreductase [Synechococcales cyanobacterium]